MNRERDVSRREREREREKDIHLVSSCHSRDGNRQINRPTGSIRRRIHFVYNRQQHPSLAVARFYHRKGGERAQHSSRPRGRWCTAFEIEEKQKMINNGNEEEYAFFRLGNDWSVLKGVKQCTARQRHWLTSCYFYSNRDDEWLIERLSYDSLPIAKPPNKDAWGFSKKRRLEYRRQDRVCGHRWKKSSLMNVGRRAERIHAVISVDMCLRIWLPNHIWLINLHCIRFHCTPLVTHSWEPRQTQLWPCFFNIHSSKLLFFPLVTYSSCVNRFNWRHRSRGHWLTRPHTSWSKLSLRSMSSNLDASSIDCTSECSCLVWMALSLVILSHWYLQSMSRIL